jgi:twitching motility protein PilT
MIYAVMTENQRAEYEKDLEHDFSVQFGEDMRFRANAFNTVHGPAITFRHIPTKIPTMAELDLPDVFQKLCALNKGLILVTGPTGSGKSTTLAAMINHINETTSKHILTIEDPVEFLHKSKKCLVNQRELNTSTQSFARALKSALREDPDVILVGEMRDLETIQLALTAAETGHLVMGTLHTNSAAKTVDRIIDVFPGEDKNMVMAMLSSSVEAIIAQTLLKRKGGGGRVAAMEIMLGTSGVRNMIREGKTPQLYSMIQVGKNVGMRTMKDHIYTLLEQDIIDEEIAKNALNITDIKELEQLAIAAESIAGNKQAPKVRPISTITASNQDF